MLIIKSLASVPLDVKLRIAQLMKHISKGPTLAFKLRSDVTISPKQGYQWPHKKDLCPPIYSLKHYLVQRVSE